MPYEVSLNSVKRTLVLCDVSMWVITCSIISECVRKLGLHGEKHV
jgi:hypothetical protein